MRYVSRLNKAKLNREIRNQVPQLGGSEGFLYYRPVGEVLSGFVAECTPGFVYIWQYAIPLYDDLSFLHMSFGARLRGSAGHISIEGKREGEVATEVLKRISDYEEQTLALSTPLGFITYLEKIDGWHTQLVSRRAYAFSLLMLGRFGEARAALYQIDSLFRDEVSKKVLVELEKS
ncbi:MAG: hypothetical protein U1D69_13720, partial [Polynucleobacter sp.]|nr:hypothetical protein [Polynucleobacter sp.]